jgi:hypothetical protein
MTDTLKTAANEAVELDDKAREFFRACGRKAKGHKGRRLFKSEARRIRAIRTAKQKAAREAKEAAARAMQETARMPHESPDALPMPAQGQAASNEVAQG